MSERSKGGVVTFDRVIKGGMIVDGRNFPRYRADIGSRHGRIDTIGRIPTSDGAEVIDASCLIVAPGFVDLHTHYDAQVFWDPMMTISPWHGVTTVVMGLQRELWYPMLEAARHRGELRTDRHFDDLIRWITFLEFSLITSGEVFGFAAEADCRDALSAYLVPALRPPR